MTATLPIPAIVDDLRIVSLLCLSAIMPAGILNITCANPIIPVRLPTAVGESSLIMYTYAARTDCDHRERAEKESVVKAR
jgi:hypothetical protein